MWNAMMGIGKAAENFYLGLIKKIILLIPFAVAFTNKDIEIFILLWVICNYLTAIINMLYLYVELKISFKLQLNSILNGVIFILPFIVFFKWMDFKLTAIKVAYIIVFTLIYIGLNWMIKNPSVYLIISLIQDLQKSFKGKLININDAV
jgi:hypothetical protein